MISYIHDGKLEIKRQKSEDIKLLIICVVFAAVCVYIGLFEDYGKLGGLVGRLLSTAVGGLLVRVIMLAAAILCIAAFVIILRHSLKGKPVLIADENGVTDNGAAASAGITVHWDNIKRIYIGEYQTQKFIELELNDTESYLRTLPPSKLKNAKMYMRIGHQPICITLVGTTVLPEDVLPDLMRLWEKYHGLELLSE